MYSDNNITFNYEEAGEGKPMLILHGYGPDHVMMMECMEPIFSTQDRYRRIYVDLPGMGKSPAADWIAGSDDMLRAVEMMIEVLFPGEHFVLVGQSYGAYMARGLLRSYAGLVDGLFLLCPCIIAEMADREVPAHLIMYSDEQLMNELTAADKEEFTSIAVVQSRSVWERYNREIVTALKAADTDFLQQIKTGGGYTYSFDVDVMEPFHKPSLILAGRQDSLTGYKDAWKLLDTFPHAAFAVLDRAGHILHLEQEELFNMMTREWLSRLQKDAA